jgi:hypothetical protein
MSGPPRTLTATLKPPLCPKAPPPHVAPFSPPAPVTHPRGNTSSAVVGSSSADLTQPGWQRPVAAANLVARCWPGTSFPSHHAQKVFDGMPPLLMLTVCCDVLVFPCRWVLHTIQALMMNWASPKKTILWWFWICTRPRGQSTVALFPDI